MLNLIKQPKHLGHDLVNLISGTVAVVAVVGGVYFAVEFLFSFAM